MLSTKFTLRSHKSSVTYIYQDPRTPFNLFTADSSGLIINWDLTIRRPKKSWQAHTDTILTISTIHNHLLTHSRDNTIKIWDESYSCILEIPCNALNFSNICIIYDLLITPASINSNNLDVYKIDKDWQITRLISDFDVYKYIAKYNSKSYKGSIQLIMMFELGVVALVVIFDLLSKIDLNDDRFENREF